jgi:muconate cycloisomerase
MDTAETLSKDRSGATAMPAARPTPKRVRTVRLEVFHTRIPLRKRVSHASHSRVESDNVVVAAHLDDGTVGYGESCPREYVTGETIDLSLELIRRASFTGLGPAADFGEAVAEAAAWSPPPHPGDDRGCVGNASRCAVELALLDAWGRSFGVPLSRVIEYLPEHRRLAEPKAEIRYSGAITSKHWFKERVSCWKQRLFGFRQVKVKVGAKGHRDIGRLRRFRAILGPNVDIRIDANEAWKPGDVVERILELEPFGITACEQPLRHEAVGCLAEVRRQVKTPIMHDESLCSMTDAERALADGTCDLFNIRLSKCGGLTRAIALAAFADKHGLGYQLGCQIGETGILSAAGRAFATSIRGIRYLEGSYERHLVRERLTREDLTFTWGGRARRLDQPGLGVSVDPEALRRVTRDRFEISLR